MNSFNIHPIGRWKKNICAPKFISCFLWPPQATAWWPMVPRRSSTPRPALSTSCPWTHLSSSTFQTPGPHDKTSQDASPLLPLQTKNPGDMVNVGTAFGANPVNITRWRVFLRGASCPENMLVKQTEDWMDTPSDFLFFFVQTSSSTLRSKQKQKHVVGRRSYADDWMRSCPYCSDNLTLFSKTQKFFFFFSLNSN